MAKVGQTVAHLSYITRPKAARIVLRKRLVGATDRETAKVAEDEAQKRKGRVCERFIIALPLEASTEQRTELAQKFAERLTSGVAGYILAIHDKNGNDVSNPHFHLVAFDKMVKSNSRGRPKSTLRMAHKNAIEDTAKMWSDLHNAMMQEWGYCSSSCISHKSFQERGIDRLPTIHEGPAGRRLANKGKEASLNPTWRNIDNGHTRQQANRLIAEINKTKEKIYEGTIGLGENYEGNPAGCMGECSEFGASGGWRFEGSRSTTPPFVEVGCNTRGNITGKGVIECVSAVEDDNGECSSRDESASHPIVCGQLGYRGRRRSKFRYYFRELIFFHQTLVSKLALIKEARAATACKPDGGAEPTSLSSTARRTGVRCDHGFGEGRERTRTRSADGCR